MLHVATLNAFANKFGTYSENERSLIVSALYLAADQYLCDSRVTKDTYLWRHFLRQHDEALRLANMFEQEEV